MSLLFLGLLTEFRKDKVHEGSKSALLQKLMNFGYIICVCLW